jgi:diamine N-acetyltransferase
MNDVIDYFAPTKDSTNALRTMARQAFSETFAHLYDPIPFSQFLEQSYGVGGSMDRGLADPLVLWQAAAVGDQVIGYVKLTSLTSPAPVPKPGAMEVQQIYVLSPWHGQGVADKLMTWALDTARTMGAPEIYLAVFDHNTRAKRFYSRHGFSEVARCTFRLGDQIDDDRVWRKTL